MYEYSTLPIALKNLAQLRMEEYRHIPKVEAVIRYMWAEDWHDKRWQEFVDYNNKTDELQKMKLLDICEEFRDFV